MRALAALLVPLMVGATAPQANVDARILAAHNRERAALGLPPLRWNPALAQGAGEWSSYLVRTGQFRHSPDAPGAEPIGENIWGGTPGHFSPEDMVGLWIAEKRYYREGVFPANSTTGAVEDVSHYTQVVWGDTREVGCAVTRGTREEILVCRYSQAGNMIGELPY